MLCHKIIGLPEPVDGDVGLELEAEAGAPLPERVKGWKFDKDNSLRGAFQGEYILKGVQKVDDDLKALVFKLCEYLNEPKVALNKKSPRTSFHVHRNITNYPILTVWMGAIAWWIFEDYIIDEYCDRDLRKDNHFCLPVSKANDLADVAFSAMQSVRPLRFLQDENLKYGAQNLWSMTQLGSIEYRCMEGSTDPNKLWNWIKMISGIFSNCEKNFLDPVHMMKVLDEKGYAYVFDLIFPGQIDVANPMFRYKIQAKCAGSLSFAMMLSFAHSNWKEYSDIMTKEYMDKKVELAPKPKAVFRAPRGAIPPRAAPLAGAAGWGLPPDVQPAVPEVQADWQRRIAEIIEDL